LNQCLKTTAVVIMTQPHGHIWLNGYLLFTFAEIISFM